MSVRITLLVDPKQQHVPSADLPTLRPATEARELPRFVQELQRYSDGPVELLVASPDLAPPDGFLLVTGRNPKSILDRWPEAQRAQIARRMVLLDGRVSPGLLEDLEHHGLAGAVEHLRFRVWQHHPERESGQHVLHGRRSVAERMGASCADPPYASDNYCVLSIDRPNLPASLVAYLEAYEAAALE